LANLSRRLMEQSVRNALLASTTRDQLVQVLLSHSAEGVL
jgi:mannitol/fructose-specific phosphotransferase system IIA component (Ntr-type)